MEPQHVALGFFLLLMVYTALNWGEIPIQPHVVYASITCRKLLEAFSY